MSPSTAKVTVRKEGAELGNGTPSQMVLLLCFGLLLKVNKNLEKSEKKIKNL